MNNSDELAAQEVPLPGKAPLRRALPIRTLSLMILVAVVMYAGMVFLADWKALRTAVVALPRSLWIEVLGLAVLSYLLRFARWHRYIGALGYRVPLLRDLEIYLAAFALTLTPGKAGEMVRSVYLAPFGVKYPHSIGAFVSERLLDLLAVGALASMAVSLFPAQRFWALGTIACVAAAVLLARSRLLTAIGLRLARRSAAVHAVKALATVRFLLAARRLAWAAPLSLMAWAAQGLALALIVHALGYALPAGTVIAIYCLSILAGAASFIPGGLGATEAAIALLLMSAGVGRTEALAASLLGRSLTLWVAVGIGVVAMGKAAVSSEKQRATGR